MGPRRDSPLAGNGAIPKAGANAPRGNAGGGERSEGSGTVRGSGPIAMKSDEDPVRIRCGVPPPGVTTGRGARSGDCTMAAVRKKPKHEAIKERKDGLDVWEELSRYAKLGPEAIEEEDHERLKWYGVYGQRPRGCGHFMLRVKIPGGRLTATKLRTIAGFARKHARGFGDITTRQGIQLHWLRVQDLPDIFAGLSDNAHIEQRFACGDAPRNLTTCPLTGILADEIVDCRPFVQSVSDMFANGGKEFSNLPRKFKTAIGGCRIHCHSPQINCLGFFGVERQRNGSVERGLGMTVGGGLRDTPHFGQSLRVFLPPDDALIRDVCRRAANLFRDTDELRHGRLRARLKFYVERIGWRTFRDQLEDYLGYKLEHDDDIVSPAGARHDDHLGVGEQKDGRSYVGVPIPRGRLSAEAMATLADLSAKYTDGSDGELVATLRQNVVLLNIPPTRVDDLERELTDAGLPPSAHPLRTSLISCTGVEFCNLAVVETKQRAKEILDHLETNVDLDVPMFISVTGCPNSCAQYQIADIGLTGVKMKHKGESVEAYHVHLGAKLGDNPRFGQVVKTSPEDKDKLKIPSAETHLAIERLVNAYLAERTEGEGFSPWVARQPMSQLADWLRPAAMREATEPLGWPA